MIDNWAFKYISGKPLQETATTEIAFSLPNQKKNKQQVVTQMLTHLLTLKWYRQPSSLPFHHHSSIGGFFCRDTAKKLLVANCRLRVKDDEGEGFKEKKISWRLPRKSLRCCCPLLINQKAEKKHKFNSQKVSDQSDRRTTNNLPKGVIITSSNF